MLKLNLFSIVLLHAFLKVICAEDYFQPEQIHISYGALPSQMIITWTTLSNVNDHVVEYGLNSLDLSVNGSYRILNNTGTTGRQTQIHYVLLNNLIPGEKYTYHCGSPKYGWSPLYFFTAMKSGQDWSPRFAVFGDMGNANAQSLSMLQEETMKGQFDAVLHVGDFAYDMVNVCVLRCVFKCFDNNLILKIISLCFNLG